MPNAFYDRISRHLHYSPEDFVAARVHRLLSHDDALSNVMQGRILLCRNAEDIDITMDPTIHVAPHVSGEPVETTGHREVRPIDVVISLQWEQMEWEPVFDGPSPSRDTTEPGKGFGTVLSYCWYLISKTGNRELKETINGEEVATVSPGQTNREVIDLTPTLSEESGTYHYGQVLIAKFEVYVDNRTGKIENLS